MSVTLVVARGRNGVIGAAGRIPWHLPADFAHFKALTLGHPMVMGRLTFESIGRPLPGRTSIVVTRDPRWAHQGVLVCGSVDEAVDRALALDEETFVIGGAQIYAEALRLGLIDRMVVSEVDAEPAGDAFFEVPPGWAATSREPREGFTVVVYEPAG